MSPSHSLLLLREINQSNPGDAYCSGNVCLYSCLNRNAATQPHRRVEIHLRLDLAVGPGFSPARRSTPHSTPPCIGSPVAFHSMVMPDIVSSAEFNH
ncbi:hypothetical protein EYF80_015060 [Liparis tanakae]|uniref:Uncharacterized protein n=1 Tax=Liparis tanakae TaxID=230148 RepID=A0A4Z2IBF3_9TELE|nr:hypothetical protein EYF80_015060 [Liparis tanakae]